MEQFEKALYTLLLLFSLELELQGRKPIVTQTKSHSVLHNVTKTLRLRTQYTFSVQCKIAHVSMTVVNVPLSKMTVSDVPLSQFETLLDYLIM